MLNEPKIYFMVAPARSGKSTYASIWRKLGANRVVVNTDHIRLAVSGKRYSKEAEPKVWEFENIMVKTLLLGGYEILLDETSTTEFSIKKILWHDPNAKPIYIKATREQCYERAHATGQSDLVEYGVIDRHFDNLEKLVKKYTGSNEITQESVERMVNLIREKINGKENL